MNSPLVNVVILTCNQFNFISTCLESLLGCNYPNLLVYLVDNNSNLEDYQKFYNKYKNNKRLKFSRLPKNIGFAGGCNNALKKIRSGYIVLLNDDTIVTKNWLNPIIEYMESHPDVGACQPKIKSMRNKDCFEYAGAAGGLMDVFGFPFCRGRIFVDIEKDNGQYDDVVDVVWTSGNCLVTKTEVIKKVGVLDEIFFIYGEEADLCWRMFFHGYRLVFIPNSVVYHYGSGTMKNFAYKTIFLHHRNGLILLFKNYKVMELIKYLPGRIIFDFIAMFFYIYKNRKFKYFFAVIAAYLNIIYLLPQIIKRRESAAFRVNINKSKYPLFKKSIILERYLFGKKKFSQLEYFKNS